MSKYIALLLLFFPIALMASNSDIELLIEKANKGDVASQYQLGFSYLVGQGVGIDIENAVVWYKKAASAGHSEAQNALGELYSEAGSGSDDSAIELKKIAIYWFTKAAEQGLARAQYNLGV
ncbi:tetratricopeptide repeat protein, partial [Shewanella sp. 10N.286.52.C2]|uniref:tetratricopeptide repeat protein n=1 Tax=Shewanella sp. 10N.286.52.C2 TaxID=1880838 RepID=UPI00105484A8